MRIISGELKGRRLMTPSDNRVRPTTDKVKEAVFSMIAGYLYESIVIDLFSGTGSLGLEAISRGANKVYFVDSDRRSISIIRENINHCKVEDRTVVLHADYASAISKIDDKADVIILDPPYSSGYITKSIKIIQEQGLLAEDGIIVAEHAVTEELPEEISGLQIYKFKKYGKINISIYKVQEALL